MSGMHAVEDAIDPLTGYALARPACLILSLNNSDGITFFTQNCSLQDKNNRKARMCYQCSLEQIKSGLRVYFIRQTASSDI